MKQVSLRAMINAIYHSLNHDIHTPLTDLYFQTLIEKLKLIDSSTPLQTQNDEALAIMKGMVLLALEETDTDDAHYLINRIQQFAENLFEIRFDLAHLHTHSGPLKIECDEFDNRVKTSFRAAKAFMMFLKEQARDIQAQYNAFRGKPNDKIVLCSNSQA